MSGALAAVPEGPLVPPGMPNLILAFANEVFSVVGTEREEEEEERDLLAEIADLLDDGLPRTVAEIAKPRKEGGIGDRPEKVTACLQEHPERFLSFTGSDATAIGRHPSAVLWQPEPRPRHRPDHGERRTGRRCEAADLPGLQAPDLVGLGRALVLLRDLRALRPRPGWRAPVTVLDREPGTELAGHLRDRRRLVGATRGAERLLKRLVEEGLSAEALPASAQLVLALDAYGLSATPR